MASNFNNSQSYLLRKLCSSLLGANKEHSETIYKKAVESLISFEDAEFHTSFSPFEEHQIIDQIANHLKNLYTNSDEVINRFHALSKSLQDTSNSDSYIKSLLCLLKIAEQNQFSKIELLRSHENEINGNFTIPTDHSCGDSINSTNFNSILSEQPVANEYSFQAIKLPEKQYDSPAVNKLGPTHHLFTDTPILEPTATSSRNGSCPKVNKVRVHADSISSEAESNESPRPNSLSVNLRAPEYKKHDIMGDFEVTEFDIMKELIFCMQGIEGKIIKYMSVKEGFHLNPCIKVDQQYIVKHLMELGYLHNEIKYYISTLFTDVGTVAQGLLNAVRRELTQYYQTLATLDSQLNYTPEIADTPLSEEDCAKHKLPTLSQLFVWSRKPFLKLRILCDVLRSVQDKRGGEIVSVLAFLSYHGNPEAKEIILRLLSSAVQPFYKQIFYWVVNGELIDTREEFFIQAENSVDNLEYKNSWDKQFVLRPSMIPKYMLEEEANQILEAGRGMNFLHNICHQKPPLTPSQVSLLDLEKNKWSDALSLIQPCNQVSELINKAYREVSKVVLQSLNENFKMLTHLEALRKYMLLGQGDFIHYLLEIIEPDLNKSVGTLHTYSLMRSLEDAIYKSNAQFDDPDVLNKLCVKMLATSERENVSEAFCLQYRLEGPLNAILKQSCIGYNRMFTFMWRVKRANYMVLKMWRGLKLLHKEVNKLIPETKPVFNKANSLVMEMVNFINHFQYYIASEVVEVQWRKFQGELEKTESLEKVLQAHNEFLDSIQTSCMLNKKTGSENNVTMAWHIRSLLDYVQELVPIVETFQTLCESELKRRRKRQESVAKCGTSYLDEQENQAAAAQFQEEMNKVKTKFRVLANQHQDKLKSLLMLFSNNQDEHDLILLSHRIDFNEYYKQNDSRLSDSLKLYKKQGL